MADEVLIRVEKRYPSGGGIRGELTIPGGGPSVTVVFGPSGAGKTTLLRCIAGLERPERGLIRFGHEVWLDTETGRWVPPQGRRVGFVFQDDVLFPHRTVWGNVAYGLRSMPWAEQAQRVAEMLRLLDLEALADRYPRTLSGGQRRRVALARALAPAPRLLLLDEPLAALDAPARREVQRLIRQVLAHTRIPAVLVTHDRDEVLAMGDRMAVVLDGEVVQVGTVEEVWSRPASPAVAQALGIENLWSGRVVGRDGDLVAVAVGDRRLWALPPEDLQDTGDVWVVVHPRDVVLEKGTLPGFEADLRVSARNRLAGRVVGFVPEEHVLRVWLDCGFRLSAVITYQAREAMDLREGDAVMAIIKAPAVRLIPHGAPERP
ncbi:MAG: ABC transporter ATP-binding protein [Acidobacteria bacterium]|nr:ABC transporter ATP-binding protein [Acidobacteriota bacterium]MDW7984165.1 ABC transporter ATP-binding protein [Acidobacteriota bacterium]